MGSVIVLYNSDGEVSLSILSEKDFMEKVNSGWYGDAPKFATQEEATNLNCLDGKYVVIKGSIVQPRPVEIIKKYEL